MHNPMHNPKINEPNPCIQYSHFLTWPYFCHVMRVWLPNCLKFPLVTTRNSSSMIFSCSMWLGKGSSITQCDLGWPPAVVVYSTYLGNSQIVKRYYVLSYEFIADRYSIVAQEHGNFQLSILAKTIKLTEHGEVVKKGTLGILLFYHQLGSM